MNNKTPFIDTLEKGLNALTDMDIDWYPFLYLRPNKDEIIDFERSIVILLHYGTFGAIITFGVLAFLNKIPFSVLSFTYIYSAILISFFIGFTLTFQWAWNRRARRLQVQT